MIMLNEQYQGLTPSYLFAEVARRAAAFAQAHPDKEIIKLSIGDVTQPLAPAVIAAMHKAVDEMGQAATFHGYGPEQGYDFLRQAIGRYYQSFGVELVDDEIFVSDGAKSDLANITDLFDRDNRVLIPDPVYPVYVDTNIMNGREIVYLEANEPNGFLPAPPEFEADLVYLCSPNNPTGAVYNRDQLKAWVDYANRWGAVLLFDAAYESFITDPDLPRSIFEIPGAKTCAIEFCSLSKTAGFTGTRCGYTVVPQELVFDNMSLNHMWNRRQTTKFNGVPYVVQRAAEAVFTEEARAQIRASIAYYQENARVIAAGLDRLGITYTGGVNSPYLWMRCPNGMGSWEFFDDLLQKAAVVGTPGEGFGSCGKGYFRLTAFGDHDKTVEAMDRIQKAYG